jgi:hypothetical protein
MTNMKSIDARIAALETKTVEPMLMIVRFVSPREDLPELKCVEVSGGLVHREEGETEQEFKRRLETYAQPGQALVAIERGV